MPTESSTIQVPTRASSFAERSQQMLSKYTEGRRLVQEEGLLNDDKKVIAALQAGLDIALMLRSIVDDFLSPNLAEEWHAQADAMEVHLTGKCTRKA